jgi:hypothetical protein
MVFIDRVVTKHIWLTIKQIEVGIMSHFGLDRMENALFINLPVIPHINLPFFVSRKKGVAPLIRKHNLCVLR